MSKKYVIIGEDSYIASGLKNYFNNQDVMCLNYMDWADNISFLRKADCIINFSVSPDFSNIIMDNDEIIDVKIAKSIVGYKPRFIFISSRKVYGTSDKCLVYNEGSPIIENDVYSVNKIHAEKSLFQILGDKLIILRPTNIIGEPVMRDNYETFMGWIGRNYEEKGYVKADLNSQTQKDFITKEYLHQNIAYIMQHECSGIYNISAGFGVTVKYILDGYVGKVLYEGENKKLKDQFIVDNTKIKKLTGIDFSIKDIEKALKMYNKKLICYPANKQSV